MWYPKQLILIWHFNNESTTTTSIFSTQTQGRNPWQIEGFHIWRWSQIYMDQTLYPVVWKLVSLMFIRDMRIYKRKIWTIVLSRDRNITGSLKKILNSKWSTYYNNNTAQFSNSYLLRVDLQDLGHFDSVLAARKLQEEAGGGCVISHVPTLPAELTEWHRQHDLLQQKQLQMSNSVIYGEKYHNMIA